MNNQRSGKRWSWRFPVLITFIVFSLLLTGVSSAYALSLEQEKKMGEQFAFQVSRQLELVDDDFAHRNIHNSFIWLAFGKGVFHHKGIEKVVNVVI